jgi:hypothetical protein
MATVKYCPIDSAIMTADLEHNPPVWRCDECPIVILMSQEEIEEATAEME